MNYNGWYNLLLDDSQLLSDIITPVVDPPQVSTLGQNLEVGQGAAISTNKYKTR